jgi:photosystem II stability/assembly factor-like uncharacterized protein
MLRSLSITAAVTGVVAAVSVACSGSLDPSIASDPSASNKKTAQDAPRLDTQESGTAFRFFAVSPVNDRVVWASAAGGTYALTTDGGATWLARTVPGAETLQFRDVEGVSAKIAYLLSIGSLPQDFRIYKTVDGGQTWVIQFENQDPNGFYDCFDFWTPRRGITFADAVPASGGGFRFPVIKTTDGETWQDIGNRLPPAQPGEAGFAASGTCVATHGGQRAWIGTGAAARARVLRTTDGGDHWTSHFLPDGFRQGTSTSGAVSLSFRDHRHGILGGGDVVASAEPQNNVARSTDGGATWTLATPTPFTGAVYGLSYVGGSQKLTVVATGPSGAAWSPDEGATWSLLPGVSDFWAVGFASRKAGWLVGGQGKILKISFDDKGSSSD